jgi:MoxR-like ATPase
MSNVVSNSPFKQGDKVVIVEMPHDTRGISDMIIDRLIGTEQVVDFCDRNTLHLVNEDFVFQTSWFVLLENYPTRLVRSHTAEVMEYEQEPQAVEFDLDRLTKEVGEMFEEKLIENGRMLAEDIKTAGIAFSNTISLSSEEHKELFLAELRKGRTTIVLPSAIEINIAATDHPAMESVVKSLATHRKAMLVGPAGTGKTYMVADAATKLNLPFYKYSCSRDSSVHDLLGYKQPTSEEYLETVFLKAYENGGIFLVDEYDAMSGDMSLFFNGVADGSKFISVPHRDTKPTAVKHKDFYIVMCGNTWGKGSHEFTGRDFQDAALLDRFRLCRHHVGYHLELEKTLLGVKHDIFMRIRTKLEEFGSYLSTRNIEDISLAIRGGTGVIDTVKMLAEDLLEEEKIILIRLVHDSSQPYRQQNYTGDSDRGVRPSDDIRTVEW